MTVQHSNSADIDAADGVSLDRDGVPRAEAIVVDARFAGGAFVVDTTTLGDANGAHRVVLLDVPRRGDVALLPHEAIDLARALLSRVRYAQGGVGR